MARTQTSLRNLWPDNTGDKANILRLMQELWHYITPTRGLGVNSTTIFAEGAIRFAQDKAVNLLPQVLDLPSLPALRPDRGAVTAFLVNAFSSNLPVSFLNLDNGKVKQLEYWHWVTLIGLDESNLTACMVDQGHKIDIDLGLWLKTSKGGGGFVTLAAS